MTHDHEEHKRHTFDAYCKKILKYTARTIYAKQQALSKREVVFTEMTEQELSELAVIDKYFIGEYTFAVLGKSIGVSDYELGDALNALPADRREIILMSYFFDMTDKEIAEKLNIARRTVANRRTSSLQKLKNYMREE